MQAAAAATPTRPAPVFPANALQLSEPHSCLSSADQAILERLPDDGWRSCLVPFEEIQFDRTPEGGFVVLGSGAYGSVGGGLGGGWGAGGTARAHCTAGCCC